MQTDEEIKKEVFEYLYIGGNHNMDKQDFDRVVNFMLSKLHTLQEEYKKELIEKIEEERDTTSFWVSDDERPIMESIKEEIHKEGIRGYNQALDDIKNIIKQ